MNPNVKAFLEMIGISEIGSAIINNPLSDRGYKVIVGSTPDKLILMANYSGHPKKMIILSPTLKSSAAGKFQLLGKYYDYYAKLLDLSDYSPASQDAIAIQQIKECKALEDVEEGRFDLAVSKCSHIWASLPGAGYGQHENKLTSLKTAYVLAGGSLA